MNDFIKVDCNFIRTDVDLYYVKDNIVQHAGRCAAVVITAGGIVLQMVNGNRLQLQDAYYRQTHTAGNDLNDNEFVKADAYKLEGRDLFTKTWNNKMLHLGTFKAITGSIAHGFTVHAQYGGCFLENCYIQKEVSCETKTEQQATDAVNNPGHYNAYIVPVVEMTDSVLATIKDPVYAAYFKTIYEYISRAHLKNGAEDIKKAQWWLDRLITKIDAGEAMVK